jgi:hypothetical protein
MASLRNPEFVAKPSTADAAPKPGDGIVRIIARLFTLELLLLAKLRETLTEP